MKKRDSTVSEINVNQTNVDETNRNAINVNEKVDLRELRKAMREVQTEKRFEHTQGVEYTAAALAMRHGASLEEALTAGLLHDCAKCLSDEEQLSICAEGHLEVSEIEKRQPYLLHGKAGAYLAEHKYGIRNEDVLNAIRYHTTGRGAMSVLEKIVFVADYIEPGRKQAQNLDEIRRLSFENLDRALVRILEDTLSYLKNSGQEIDPQTELTLEYYRKIC